MSSMASGSTREHLSGNQHLQRAGENLQDLLVLGGSDQLPAELLTPFAVLGSEVGPSIFGTSVDIEGSFWGSGGCDRGVGVPSHGRWAKLAMLTFGSRIVADEQTLVKCGPWRGLS